MTEIVHEYHIYTKEDVEIIADGFPLHDHYAAADVANGLFDGDNRIYVKAYVRNLSADRNDALRNELMLQYKDVPLPVRLGTVEYLMKVISHE